MSHARRRASRLVICSCAALAALCLSACRFSSKLPLGPLRPSRGDTGGDANASAVVPASYEFSNGRWVRSQAEPLANPVLHRAEEHLLKGEADAALDELDDLLDSDDTTPDVRRRAMLLAAEAHYAKGAYVPARDLYEQLLEKYPGTEDASTAAVRLLQIARHWLALAEAGGDDAGFSAVRQKSHPLFDIDGHAIKILDFIQQQDPGSPVADDAVMTAGDYFFRKGKYHQATLYYDLLIDAYPKSPYLPQAYLRAAEARLHIYDGADYDKRPLQKARELLEAAATQFPELREKRPEIYKRLAELEERQAERDFRVAEFYERIGKPNAAIVYYQFVIRDYPDTGWARLARTRLEKLGLNERAEAPPDLGELLDRAIPGFLKTARASAEPRPQGGTTPADDGRSSAVQTNSPAGADNGPGLLPPLSRSGAGTTGAPPELGPF